ncbi:hypothetical protein RHSIM_Rhsim07G0030800 [Rhododendron simsii]|uniref:Autophagy-related protein n=1 Tax=Rhododendron simsii TaxID=118357 RepID=A0A834LFX4_RHOSS|nr:hypothetical protein RHSIM_Rhsim07G0030800 [Rhododendron simsii]
MMRLGYSRLKLSSGDDAAAERVVLLTDDDVVARIEASELKKLASPSEGLEPRLNWRPLKRGAGSKMTKSYFKQEHDFAKRHAEAARIREKYPDRIPVEIVEFVGEVTPPSQLLALTSTNVKETLETESSVSTVIVEKAERSDIPNIDKKKYLVPADLTVGQFVYVIRKRIKLSAEKAIFIFVDNVLPPTGAIMSTIYDEKKDEDGFLYVTYSGENTFGLPVLH